MVDSLVTHSRFCQTLTYKILQVLFKALFVLQETHGYIIIGVTVIQLGEECPIIKIVERNEKRMQMILWVMMQTKNNSYYND